MENAENNSENSQVTPEISENVAEQSEQISENIPAEAENEDPSSKKEIKSSSDPEELSLPEPDISEEEEKKKKDQPLWLKKKLERERRKENERIAAAEAEAEALRKENLVLKSVAPEGKRPADPFLPMREQFDNDSEYFLALSDYRESKRFEEIETVRRKQLFEQHEEDFQNKLAESVETGKTKYKDFEEKTDFILYGKGFPSNRAMAEAIVESEYKDDVLYFLGTHLKEAERIARLNPISAAKEIAKIEMRFSERKKQNITKAPPPITPLTKGRGSQTYGDPGKMDAGDFRKWYESTYGGR